MSVISDRAYDILCDEYNRLISNGVNHINAIDFEGRDAFSLEAFSTWTPEEIQKAKTELLSSHLIEDDVQGNCHLPE